MEIAGTRRRLEQRYPHHELGGTLGTAIPHHELGETAGGSTLKIFLKNPLIFSGECGIMYVVIEMWLSLVERCVREHRTLGALCRAVCRAFPFTVQSFGIFAGLKSRSKFRMTTSLTTYTKFGCEKIINRGVAQFGRAPRSGA